MNSITLIPPQTAAKPSAPFYTDQYDCITVSADKLATTEMVTISMLAGGTVVPVTLPDGTTQATLTATAPALPLEGGPRYVFTKGVTASACGVYVDVKVAV